MSDHLPTLFRYLLVALASLPLPVLGQGFTASESAAAEQALVIWYECDECVPDQLLAITKYGQSIVPSLVATLNGGLSPASRELMGRLLRDRHAKLAYQGVGLAEPDFVSRHLNDFDAQYRIRAAQALCAISGPEARKALQSTAANPSYPQLGLVIAECMKRMK